MSRLPVHLLNTNTRELDLGGAKVHHLPNWGKLTHPQRLGVMRQLAMMRGRDPRIAKLALSILRRAGAPPREYVKQASALLAWIQNPRNFYYVNEPGERLQDPVYSIEVAHGDCFAEDTLVLRDDFALIKIQDVKPGERIWGRDRWSEVTAAWAKGPLPVTEVDLNNGSTLRLTEEHKVYVKSCEKHGPSCVDIVRGHHNCKNRSFSWTRIHVSELKKGMEILQPEKIEQTPTLDADDSWLIGAYVAEGWKESCRAFVSGLDGHWKEATKHRAKEIAERKGWAVRWHRKYLAFNSTDAVKFFSECGGMAGTKQLPARVLKEGDLLALDEALRLDSSKNSQGSGWTFGTISPLLATQYRVLQRALGRSTSARVVVNHGGFGKNPIHRIGVRPGRTDKAEKRLCVKEIRRQSYTVPCYDISTDDHYVYLPEADATVSNCDDAATLLAALCESIKLPWKFVLSGRDPAGQKVRLIEGEKEPRGVSWSHIYLTIGTPPFNPNRWYFAEPTIRGVPLGWDVVSGDSRFLPEMERGGGPQYVMGSPKAPMGYRPVPLPAQTQRSPAYSAAYGAPFSSVSALGPLVGAEVAATMQEEKPSLLKNMLVGIATGVSVGVLTNLILERVRAWGEK